MRVLYFSIPKFHGVPPERIKEMINEAKKADSPIICHQTLTYKKEHAVCRGFYDNHATYLLQVASHIGIVEYVHV